MWRVGSTVSTDPLASDKALTRLYRHANITRIMCSNTVVAARILQGVCSIVRAISLCGKGVQVWNYLCDDLKMVDTVAAFKRKGIHISKEISGCGSSLLTLVCVTMFTCVILLNMNL